MTTHAATAAASASLRKYPPFLTASSRTAAATASSHTRACSDEHSVPLSKVLPSITSFTALGRSAVFST